MLQIGHRLSYDFDLFTDEKITDEILEKVKSSLGRKITIDIVDPAVVFIKTPQNIDIHLVQHPFRALKKPIITSSISLFHLDDLVSNKAYTLGRRPAWRDYVDLFFLLKWKYYKLESIVALANEKFKNEFNDKLFLEQLVYFEDVKVVETTFLKERYSFLQIKSFLEKEVKKYLKTVLG